MPSDAAIAEQGKRAQGAVRAASLTLARDAWKLLDPYAPSGTSGLWSLTMLEVIRKGRQASSARALETYNDLRPGDAWFEPEPVWDEARALKSLLITGPLRIIALRREGLSASQAKKQAFLLNGRMISSAVLDGGRQLTEAAIANDRLALGYARLPSPGACAFCMMLASRGAVYSKSTVLTTTSRSRRRGSGKSFHEGCNCSMFPVFDREQELPDLIDQANSLYTQASTDAAGTSEILANMRKLGGLK